MQWDPAAPEHGASSCHDSAGGLCGAVAIAGESSFQSSVYTRREELASAGLGFCSPYQLYSLYL